VSGPVVGSVGYNLWLGHGCFNNLWRSRCGVQSPESVVSAVLNVSKQNMGLKKFQIAFDNPWSTYYSGQPVTGRLLLTVDSPKKIRGMHVRS
jgi:hypothetical protein